VELASYVWDQDKTGRFLNRHIDEFNHAMDGLRYSVEQIRKPSSISFD
jgi:phage terminase large subunit